MTSQKSEEERINEFAAKTIESFQFLEKEFGYKRKELEKKYFEYPRERRVFIRYFGKKVAVEIMWYIGDANITVGLYELQKRKIPEKVSFYGNYGYSRAINLDSFVRMITDGEITSPIPEYGGNISFAEMCRRTEKAIEIIDKNIGGVLKTFAERLKKYGAEILKGDTSIFPKVQEYHREFYDMEI